MEVNTCVPVDTARPVGKADNNQIKDLVAVWLVRAQVPATGLEAELKTAQEKIKQLENAVKEEKGKSEKIKEDTLNKTNEYEKVMLMMAAEIKNLQEGKDSLLPDIKEKLEVVEEDNKNLLKRLNDALRENKEVAEKLETHKKVVESVIKSNEEKEAKNKTKTKCKNTDKPGGCRWGVKCKFAHEEGQLVKTSDCAFWLDGNCRYSEKMCWNIHEPDKKGTKAKVSVFQEGPVETRLPPGLDVSQTSAHGMEGQGWEKPMSRKTRRKMRATAQEGSQSPASHREEEQSSQTALDVAITPNCPQIVGLDQTIPTFLKDGNRSQTPQEMLLLALQALLQQTRGNL